MLVYYLINHQTKFQNQNLNLSSELYFEYKNNSNIFNVRKNMLVAKDLWGEHIKSVSVLIGSNGAGKTSILEFVRERFFYGAALEEEIILVVKKQGFYEVMYSESLFPLDYIVINGERHVLSNQNVLDIILSDNTILKLKFTAIGVPSQKILKETRLANENALIYFGTNWNYSARTRFLDDEANIRGYEYYDFSLGNSVDKVLRKKFKLPDRIANLEDQFDINYDDRFNVDYLFELDIEKITEILNYISIETNREIIKDYLSLPSHIKIYCDYMNSEERANFFLHDKPKYMLRFEKESGLFKIEQLLYSKIYLLEEGVLKAKNSMLLRVIDNFFTDIELMISTNKLQEMIKINEIDYIDRLSNENSTITCLNCFVESVIKSVDEYASDSKIPLDKDVLKARLLNICRGYITLIDFLENYFFIEIESEIIEVPRLREESSSIAFGNIKVEIPIITTNAYNLPKVKKLLHLYRNIGTKGNIFYYNWSGLSSGEENLLNLLARLNNVLENINKPTILLMLDEVEISLHPEWQRRYMRVLIENVERLASKYQKEVQFLITTHSPIITSDVPNYAISYLERNGDKHFIYKRDGQTFGNNIHNLYIDTFYLDTTIGAYANQVINTVIEQLNSSNIIDEKKLEEITSYIDIIGDPLIKQVLEEMMLNKVLSNSNSEKRLNELKSLKEYVNDQILRMEKDLDK